MNQTHVCRYIAREFGVVAQDSAAELRVKIGRRTCTVTPAGWSLRTVRRTVTGTSPLTLMLAIHKGQPEMTLLTAAMMVREIEHWLAQH